mmetsp:Transcript_95359/g.267073  ORF Transcript_95359/g.267073 Transcript_95359/m.267073 type:complete len:207 (+) Transcript_95359:244-864(+)
MLAIKPGSRSRSQEELASIGVASRVRHRQHTRNTMRDESISFHTPFVIKFVPINRFSTCSIATLEVATLAHESRYHPMERGAFEMQLLSSCQSDSFFSSTKSPEILSRFRDRRSKQFHNNAPGLFISNLHIKINFRVVGRGSLLQRNFLQLFRLPAIQSCQTGKNKKGHDAKEYPLDCSTGLPKGENGIQRISSHNRQQAQKCERG